ncbi:MAG: hypothetical protein EZS28_018805 [Streblomastix strix]|uniref:Uncharacterized protein n=1 Tax=Streblomastix strix TaxID=222440 RepID=A0A5J4VSV6_9EUKA|nr:MAG: hypothetical protein EZS28_018805 [Streblomastix strix]
MSAIVGNIGVVTEFKVCDIRYNWSGGRCHKPIIQGTADLINVVHFGRKGIQTGLPDSDSEGGAPFTLAWGAIDPPNPLPRGPSPLLTPPVHDSNLGQVDSDSQFTGRKASELRQDGLGQIIKLVGEASPLLKSISDKAIKSFTCQLWLAATSTFFYACWADLVMFFQFFARTVVFPLIEKIKTNCYIFRTKRRERGVSNLDTRLGQWGDQSY